MAKIKQPQILCPTCKQPVIILLRGDRAVRCDPASVSVLTVEGETVTGFRTHTCAKAKSRKVKPVFEKPKAPPTFQVPAGEDYEATNVIGG